MSCSKDRRLASFSFHSFRSCCFSIALYLTFEVEFVNLLCVCEVLARAQTVNKAEKPLDTFARSVCLFLSPKSIQPGLAPSASSKRVQSEPQRDVSQNSASFSAAFPACELLKDFTLFAC